MIEILGFIIGAFIIFPAMKPDPKPVEPVKVVQPASVEVNHE